jgi:hypothetical protein
LGSSWIEMPAVTDLLAQREPQHERQHHVIDQGRAQEEHERRGDQERQEGVALVLVEARGHEAVQLPGQDREGQDHGPEPGQLQLGEEELQGRGIDQAQGLGVAGRDVLQAHQGQQQVERAVMAAGVLGTPAASGPP